MIGALLEFNKDGSEREQGLAEYRPNAIGEACNVGMVAALIEGVADAESGVPEPV
jgi:hypothetical protein